MVAKAGRLRPASSTQRDAAHISCRTDYISMATHDVASQLSKAGVRLAFMLNKALGSPQ